MEYKYMCIGCGNLVCELITTIKIKVPTKCPNTGNKVKWAFMREAQQQDSPD